MVLLALACAAVLIATAALAVVMPMLRARGSSSTAFV